jgi:ubiquinone/menaquinone biosynthesis C-methylase UbiE
MDEKKIHKIKDAVKRNFEQSSDKYSIFENKYRFFSILNSNLVDRMKIPSNARVLDIGCGTGASTRQICETISGSTVWGLDNSPSMLDVAKNINPDSERLKFIEGDAADLSSAVKERMDAIIYSASIFLIPDYQASLSQARDLLEPGGALGLTFMVGVFDNDENALVRADQSAHTNLSQKKPVELDNLITFVKGLFSDVNAEIVDFTTDAGMLKEFFSIQAMSAGLYPTLSYEDRLKMLETLFSHLSCDKLAFRWNLITAIR